MRTAFILTVALLCGCNYGAEYRAEYLSKNPQTKYAKEINAGHILVGMTEGEARAADPDLRLIHQMSYEGGGWSRTWRDHVNYVYVDDGFVTAVSWHGR